MVQILKVPVSGNQKNFENQIIPAMNYSFSKHLSSWPLLGFKGSFSSAANKNMMSKISTKRDFIT